MNAQTLIDNRKNEILRLAALHGARSIQVFGSTVSGQPELANDIDFLVDLAEDRSLLDQVALQQDLEQLLGTPVDVVLVGGISPHLEHRIMTEAVPL